MLGVDLSPIQPEWVPPNLRFQVDDVEREWTFRPSSYDLIFGRMLRGSIHDWPRFFEQSFQTLDSEGWIEVQDICFPVRCDDGTLKADSYLARWSKCMIKATKADGRSIEATKADGCSAEGSLLYKSKLEAAGFINVKEFVYMWPMNWWPAREHYKDLGKWCYYNIAGGLSGISMRLFTKNLGWEQAEVEAFLAEVRKDMKDRNIHAWWPM